MQPNGRFFQCDDHCARKLSPSRFCTTIASYLVGALAGIFAPILSLAASIGLAFAGLMHMVVPTATGASRTFTIAATGRLLTASARSPVVGLVPTLELTGALPSRWPAPTHHTEPQKDASRASARSFGRKKPP